MMICERCGKNLENELRYSNDGVTIVCFDCLNQMLDDGEIEE